MPKLGVPKRYRTPLRALAELPGDAAERLVTAVTGAAPLRDVGELERIVQDALSEQSSQADFEWLVAALVSLRGRLRDVPLKDVVEGAASSQDLELPVTAQEALREHLLALLSSIALSSTANAIELLTQNERNYRTARVLTDIRHVFTDDANERPVGAVIIEVLAIQTWNGDGEAETLHVAMDERDLEELREAMERALVKTANLRGMLAEQKMPYFELDKREI